MNEPYVAERCEPHDFQLWRDSWRCRRIRRKRPSTPPRCGRRRARGRPALCHRRQRRDLLRPRRHRAQPGLDHGHGHGEPRDGDRQYRPQRRRREPAARPEQRAGRLRHGLVPARVHRLSPRLRRRDAASCSSRPGASARVPSRVCASPTCWTARSRARSRASTCRARTSRSPTPTPAHVTAGLGAMECVVVQDIFLDETANCAHLVPAGLSVSKVAGGAAACAGIGFIAARTSTTRARGARRAALPDRDRRPPRGPTPRGRRRRGRRRRRLLGRPGARNRKKQCENKERTHGPPSRSSAPPSGGTVWNRFYYIRSGARRWGCRTW